MQNTDVVVPIDLPVPNEVFSVAEAAELGRQIGANWQKTARQVLETAGLCVVAFERYRSRGLPAVLRAAHMTKSTFMKLVTIGRNQRLRRIEALLPPSFTIIHQLCQLSDETFEEAVKAEVIHPHVRRTEIEALRKPSGSQDKQAAKLPAVVKAIAAGSHCELLVPNSVGPADCVRIGQLLQRLKRFGVEIVPTNTEAHEDS